MRRDDIASLISVKHVKDAHGVFHDTDEKRTVFVNVKSATATEFFQGGRNGLKPALVFTLFAPDYHDEPRIEYRNKVYSIYRTYLKDNVDEIELHAEEKAGTV